ncbi:MAG: GYD domain-containing protein [Alphaproteobacteria bacterium]|nr:GYD domain-containing protein [Alphaproteobacteria bacterium]MBV9551242.1 GYD domain-containing protein [Alphaproteobacteria bacterium]
MAHYLIRWQFKDATAKALVDKPQDRTAPATALIEGFGGKLHCYYFAFGDYDGLGIAEFPDAVSAAACSMKAASTGAFSRFETTALLTGAEAEAAMRKAKDAGVQYRAPNA